MNILLFTLEYPPFHGGVANYYGNLVKFWPEPNNIFVLNNNNNNLIKNNRLFLKWLPAISELKKIVKNHNINHVVIGQVLPLGLIGLIFLKFYGLKYSVIFHGLDFTSAIKFPRKKFLTKIIIKNAKCVISSNVYTADLIKTFAKNKMGHKIIVARPGVENVAIADYNAQNVLELKKKYGLSDKIILLSVGRLAKRKGFDKVIESLPAVLESTPNLRYVILGDGEERYNFNLIIKNLKLTKHVIIINETTDKERDEWYRACDIFCMPSRNINGDFEGFGIVYLEANMAGKPVIAGKAGGAGEAVINGFNGLLADGENINEISEAVIKLAHNENLRKKLGERGRERAIKEFDWKKQIMKIYEIINKIPIDII